MRGINVILALAVACSAPLRADATGPEGFLGFRLLELERQVAKWGSAELGRGAEITYAIVTRPVDFNGARNCRSLLPPEAALERSGISRPVFRREVATAFRMWEAAADVKFHEVSDPATAGILIGAQGVPNGRAFTNVDLKDSTSPGRKVIGQSLICFNPSLPWKVGFDGNLDVYDLRYTIAHEIGHAIGLDHPGASGQLMSFRYDEQLATLQAGDILGATALYGSRRGSSPAAASGPGGSRRAAGGPGEYGMPFGIGEPPPEQAPLP